MKNRLKEIRMKDYCMDQKEFAKYLNVPNSTYCNWEIGLSYPRLELAFQIAEKLNKKVDDIWYLK